MEFVKDKYSISTNNEKLDIAYIHQFLSHSYWAEGIPPETVQRSIHFSMCFGVYNGPQQVGFARVVTDYATFGYLADVFIDENYRGHGLSKWLMEVIMGHPNCRASAAGNWLPGMRMVYTPAMVLRCRTILSTLCGKW